MGVKESVVIQQVFKKCICIVAVLLLVGCSESRHKDTISSEAVISENMDNVTVRGLDQDVPDVYKQLLFENFTERDYYCLLDLNHDGVYELAATSELADESGRFKSLVACIDYTDKIVKSRTLSTDQRVGFSKGYGSEDGRLLVRTGHESVHHYIFSISDDEIESSDFLVLDNVIVDADKSVDRDRYEQYVKQDKGDFCDLMMWRITDENLKRDLSGDITETPDSCVAIAEYLQVVPRENTLGIYDYYIEDIFQQGYGDIVQTYGEPVGKKVRCILRKDGNDSKGVLQYVSDYVWCNNGKGFYASECEISFRHGAQPRVPEHILNKGMTQDIDLYNSSGRIDMVSGTLSSFFNVYEETYSLSDFQNMVEEPLYHNPLDDRFNVVFCTHGHTVYVVVDLKQNIVKQDSEVMIFNDSCDTSVYELLFDADGNITASNI